MKVLRKLADLVVFSNLFVAFAVGCLTLETVILVAGRIDLRYPLFVFFATLFLYNFHRVYRLNARSGKELNERRHRWLKENKLFFALVFLISSVGLAYTTFNYLYFILLLFLIPVIILSFGYSIPVIPKGKRWIRLRDIPLLKIFLITFVLSWVTVLMPLWFYTFETSAGGTFEPVNNEGLFFSMIRRMLFIFAITVPFDIRDLEHDSFNGLKTIPVLLGEKRSLLLSQLALLLFIVLAIIQGKQYHTWLYPSALVVSAVITGIVISFANKSRKEYFYTFAVEGMMVIQFVLIYLAYWLSLE